MRSVLFYNYSGKNWYLKIANCNYFLVLSLVLFLNWYELFKSQFLTNNIFEKNVIQISYDALLLRFTYMKYENIFSSKYMAIDRTSLNCNNKF